MNILSDGWELWRGLCSNQILSVENAIIDVAGSAINDFCASCPSETLLKLSREDISLVYNAMQHHPNLLRLVTDDRFLVACATVLGDQDVMIVDTALRIDMPNEDKFLFGWHQDYWFSECSTDAVVAWIPLVDIDADIGGVELAPYSLTGKKVFAARKKESAYNSYADAIVLDEEVDLSSGTVKPTLRAGDVLFFNFDVLHRSVPNRSNRIRLTIQNRVVSLNDPQFVARKWKKGTVTKGYASYFDGAK